MSDVANRLRTDKEKIYGRLLIVFGPLLWVIVGLGLMGILATASPAAAGVLGVYIFYGILAVVFIHISSLAYRANAFGNMVLLSPEQFPDLHAMVVAGARDLKMGTPQTFLYNSNGQFNAFARRIFGNRFVFLTSALVEADDDEQIRFVIGHELGHHAAGHLNPWMNFLKFPGRLVPFLYPAYSRARELTCDRIGLHLSNDLQASRSSLLMLGCGCRRLNSTLNCEAFVKQEALMPPVFGFLTEIFRSHPRLTRRLAALNRQHENRVN